MPEPGGSPQGPWTEEERYRAHLILTASPDELRREIRKLEAQLHQAREALGVYADESNWHWNGIFRLKHIVHEREPDRGAIAREALSSTPGVGERREAPLSMNEVAQRSIDEFDR